MKSWCEIICKVRQWIVFYKQKGSGQDWLDLKGNRFKLNSGNAVFSKVKWNNESKEKQHKKKSWMNALHWKGNILKV